MKNDELLHKWVHGKLSKQEKAEFEQRPEYDSLKELYQHTEQLAAPKMDSDKMLADILSQPKKQATGRRVFLSSWVKYGVAASIALVGLWFLLGRNSSQMITHQVAQGEQKKGVLPDNSTFVLNAESSLTYDVNNWDSNRNLDLQGEAFFKVEKGSKFVVNTANGAVQVLGTQFNVRARKNVLEVQCRSGKVAVLSTKGTILEELTTNDAVRIMDNKVADKWQLQVADQSDWTKGISRFKNVALATVLEEIERQYAIEINATQVNINEKLSCNFQHSNLEVALKTCLQPLGIQAKIEGDKVLLSQ